ncbi:ATP-binding protein [Streptomyces sp. NPDC017529]|uniref:ATP-binding protein n=1 Tax=Streptomyces sp. NPDC017529 TaxID=3365000 RepID=UPI0037AD5A68
MSSTTAARNVTAPAPLVVTLESCPQAAATARDVTAGHLRSLGPPVDPDTRDAVVLIVSELVTNAVRHAEGRVCTLRLAADARSVTVSVADSSPRVPHERDPDVRGEGGGFGWPMVRRLAASTSVRPTPRGKTVEAVVARVPGPSGRP